MARLPMQIGDSARRLAGPAFGDIRALKGQAWEVDKGALYSVGVVSQLRLFDDIARTDSRPARYSEGSFAFLNRVDDPFFEAVRLVLESWFARYPEEHQHELRASFRGDDQREIVPAFWELYLFELHRRLGFAVTVHPSVPGTTKRPDFRLDKGEHAFYLEAAVVGHSDEEMARRLREAIVLDMINDCRSTDFSLSADWESIGQTTPRRDEVIGKVDAWLTSLDWQTERERLEPYASDDPRPLPAPTRIIEFGDWSISLTAYPRSTREMTPTGGSSALLPFERAPATTPCACSTLSRPRRDATASQTCHTSSRLASCSTSPNSTTSSRLSTVRRRSGSSDEVLIESRRWS
jgi:hypothetical protein